ncbi:MAG: hypothetical protein R3F62_28915 [Planctomycetota bacterium]
MSATSSERLRAHLDEDMHEQLCQVGMETGLISIEHVLGAPRDGTFAQRLVNDGTLSPSQLSDLRREAAYRVARGEDKALGALMVNHGYAATSLISAALDQQRRAFEGERRLVRLSELLVQAGTLTPGHVVALRKLRALSFQ